MSKHHSHEISDHPEVQWALELLKPDPNYEPSIASKYASEVIFMGSAFAIPSLTNFFNKKPFYAGECPSTVSAAPEIRDRLSVDLTSRHDYVTIIANSVGLHWCTLKSM